MKNSKGQSQISFSMIFSVILIIFFVAFAIYGINKFLELQRLAQIGRFKSDFQEDINGVYKSTQSSNPFNYSIPKTIKQVCFVNNRVNPRNSKTENMYFIPDEKYEGYMLENVNITKTIEGSTNNELCILTSNGRVSLTLKKDWNEILVVIER
jgi:hypothetical protein